MIRACKPYSVLPQTRAQLIQIHCSVFKSVVGWQACMQYAMPSLGSNQHFAGSKMAPLRVRRWCRVKRCDRVPTSHRIGVFWFEMNVEEKGSVCLYSCLVLLSITTVMACTSRQPTCNGGVQRSLGLKKRSLLIGHIFQLIFCLWLRSYLWHWKYPH